MDRRSFLLTSAGLLTASALPARAEAPRFQYCLLKVGDSWGERRRALVRLSFEITRRCNIPIEASGRDATLRQVAEVGSPFLIISGKDRLPMPSADEASVLRLVLESGGILLFDDCSKQVNGPFYSSAVSFMQRVFPEQSGPQILPQDHAIYQSYYLLKQARGLLDKRDYLEGWTLGHRTPVLFSHNDLLGALEADQLGNWSRPMELGGGFRRELCFRLAINLTYYALTVNYKKDRAFPPIIERRRRQ